MKFWVFCHGCGAQALVDVEDSIVFTLRHSPHTSLITRVLKEQLEQWNKDLITEATELLENT